MAAYQRYLLVVILEFIRCIYGEGNSSGDLSAGATRLLSLDATCGATSIHVDLIFEKPFDGVIYSKGAFYTPECVYVLPASGEKEFEFDIPINQCGTTENKPTVDGKKGERTFENTLVMQNDAHFQDILDVVRKIRCSTASQYERIVDFSPINVNMKDVVTASFTSDDVRVSIDVQNGRGPFAQSLNQGFIQIGDTVTLVVFMTAQAGKWDIHVRECIALDSQERATLTLQDKAGCLTQPKIMSPFQTTHDRKEPKIQIAYSFMKAFRFPDDMQVQIKCVVAVCRDQCERPDACGSSTKTSTRLTGRLPGRLSNSTNETTSEADRIDSSPTVRVPYWKTTSLATNPSYKKSTIGQTDSPSTLPTSIRPKRKREVMVNTGTLPVKRIFNVISPEDIANLRNSSVVMMDSATPPNSLCVNQVMFTVLLAFLFMAIILTSIALTITCIRNRTLRARAEKEVDNYDSYDARY